MAKDQKAFPIIPKKHWWNLRNQFKKNIPGVVSTSYLANVLKMAESSARGNVLPSLRLVGLINEEGSTIKENVTMFRDDKHYGEFCKKVLDQCYPQEIRDIYFEPDSDLIGIRDWFMNKTAVGESGAYKMATFYLMLLQADPSIANDSRRSPSKGKTKVDKKSKPSKKVVNTNERQAVSEKADQPSIDQRGKGSKPSLNINIEVHISSDATPDQIETVFINMAKYIYKN